MDPIWQFHIFQRGWFNHQPDSNNRVVGPKKGWLVKIGSGQAWGSFFWYLHFSEVFEHEPCAVIQKQITAVVWFLFLWSDFVSWCQHAVFHWPPSHRFAPTNDVSGPVYETQPESVKVTMPSFLFPYIWHLECNNHRAIQVKLSNMPSLKSDDIITDEGKVSPKIHGTQILNWLFYIYIYTYIHTGIFGIQPDTTGSRPRSLRGLAAIFLQKRLDKEQRLSDWQQSSLTQAGTFLTTTKISGKM